MSDFSTALKDVFDKTSLFERHEWTTFMFIPIYSSELSIAETRAREQVAGQARIERWLNDIEIPRPSDLYLIYTVLEHSDVPEEPVSKFLEMTKRPAREVSPHGRLMLPTVWDYMTRPAFDDLSSRLAKLSPTERGDLLESLYPVKTADPS